MKIRFFIAGTLFVNSKYHLLAQIIYLKKKARVAYFFCRKLLCFTVALELGRCRRSRELPARKLTLSRL